MAISASISISPGTPNIAGNYTPVTFSIVVSWTYGSYDHYSKSVTWTINGANHNFTRGKINPNRTTSGSQTLASKVVNIYHNADGTKTVSSSCSIPTATSSGTVTASNSRTLSTIPRATTPSASASSVAIGGSITINTPRASTEFTHTLEYKVGSGSYVSLATNVRTSYKWPIPESIASSIPSSTSATVTIRCTTKNGSTTIGSAKTCTFTLTVPNTAAYKPAISSIAISELTSGMPSALSGIFIQNKSKLKIAVTRTAGSGSAVKSTTVKIDGKTYVGQTVNTDLITSSGSLTVSVTVEDNRGRTASKDFTVSVVEYHSPTISNFSVERCNSDGSVNDEGEYLKVTYSVDISPLSNKNAKTAKISYKKQSESTWTDKTVTLSTYTDKNKTAVYPANSEYSYDVKLEVNDSFNIPTSISKVLASAFSLMDFHHSGTGIGIGKVSEKEDTLDVALSLIVKNIDFTITEEEYDELISLLGGGRRLISILQSFVKSGGVEGEDGGHKMALSWDGSHVIVSIDNNAATKTLLDTSMANDYVVEQGVSGGWNYEKWNSGRAKAWRKTTSSNFGTSGQVGGFYYRIYSNNIPSGIFVEITDAHADCRWGTGVSWASARNITPTKFEAIYFSNQNGGAGEFYHEVKGRWK